MGGFGICRVKMPMRARISILPELIFVDTKGFSGRCQDANGFLRVLWHLAFQNRRKAIGQGYILRLDSMRSV
jgi:hypothetical protein